MKHVVVMPILFMVNVALGQDATLKMRFVFKGEPPEQKQIQNPAAPPGARPVMDEKLLVDPESRGIQNVALYLVSDVSSQRSEGKKHVLTMENARFSPRLIVTRAGDTLEIVDKGPGVHDPDVMFLRNRPHLQLLAAAAGRNRPISLKLAEPIPISIDSKIYPWMRAFMLIMDHPFAAVSDAKGILKIDGLPAETSLEFRLFHEAARTIDCINLDDKRTTLDGNKIKITLKPGENDLGDILVPPFLFYPHVIP